MFSSTLQAPSQDNRLIAGGPRGDIVNCRSRLDKEGLSGIPCPVTRQPRVAPRTKSGLQAQ